MITEEKVTAGAGGGSPEMNLRRTVLAIVVFYLVLLLLNAGGLHESVQRLPFGTARAFWLNITGPLSKCASALKLDRPRALLRSSLGARINRGLED